MLPVIAEGIFSLVSSLINRFLPDTAQAKRDALDAALREALIQSTIDIEQAKTNENEASNDNIFVAGWRPFIGWVCGIAFGWQYLICPILTYLITVSGHVIPAMPLLGFDEMMPVLMGMLGLGGLRTYEKINRNNNRAE